MVKTMQLLTLTVTFCFATSFIYTNSKDILGQKILAATAAGSIEDINKAMTLGADVNYEDEYGTTPLLLALREPYLVKYLLAKGANPNASKSAKIYALSDAANIEQWETVKILIKNGADPNLQDIHLGLTALHWAVIYKNIEIVKLLLMSGANTNLESRIISPNHLKVMNKGGRTPLWFAQDYQIAELLINNGANAQNCDIEGVCILHFAAQLGYIGLAKALIKSKVDINIRTKSGETALQIARKAKQREIVTLLLAAGARE